MAVIAETEAIVGTVAIAATAAGPTARRRVRQPAAGRRRGGSRAEGAELVEVDVLVAEAPGAEATAGGDE